MEWLKRNSELCPDKRFLNDLTFQQVFDRVVTLAGRLNSLIENTSRVAVYAENSPAAAVFILALLALKKEILLLNFNLTQAEITRQQKKLNIQHIFSTDESFISFSTVDQTEPDTYTIEWQTDPGQIAVIMNTSATTGEFKSVPIRWRQISAHAEASARILGVTETDNWLLFLPLFHISGLSVLFRSLYNGTGVTIMRRFDESRVLELIGNKKVTMVSVVPTVLARIADKITTHSLRVILLGGEYIPGPLVRLCLGKKLPVYKTYGMTETTSQAATFCILDYPEKLASAGMPLPGTEIEIRNSDIDRAGEIWIKSPMLVDGYLGQERIDGYFNTDDIGYLDQDGFLYVLNRRKDLIISGGENIYPKEIEDILYQLPGVKECAVVGRPDEKWGQVPILYIAASITETEIHDYLATHLAKYKRPKKIIYMQRLPKNDSGKVMRKALQEIKN